MMQKEALKRLSLLSYDNVRNNKNVSFLQGNILDDEVLINTLSQSKITSDEITTKVAEAEKTEIAIDETREAWMTFLIAF